MKSIIIISQSAYNCGGAGTVAITNARILSDSGYDVHFITTNITPKEHQIKDVHYHVINVIGQKSNPNLLKGFFDKLYNKFVKDEMTNILKEFDPHSTIVHVHNWPVFSYSLFDALENWGGKYCVTLHDFYTICPNSLLYNFREKKICTRCKSASCLFTSCDQRGYIYKLNAYARFFFQKIIGFEKKVQNVIYVSEFERNVFHKHGCIFKNEVVIDNPITINPHTKKNKESGYYLFVGRLVYEKGCDLFCQSLKDLKQKGIVVGDGPERESLAQKFDNILFVGWKSKDDVMDYMCKAKALVLCSRWYETAGLVVMEALVNKIPCIVPKQSASATYLKNGVNGLLYECDNLSSLEDCIARIEDDSFRLLLKTNLKNNATDVLYNESAYLRNVTAFYDVLI